MLLTEAEAKDRWCPHAGRTLTATGLIAHSSLCIASECMAWRSVIADKEHTIEAIKRYRNETGATLVEAKDWVLAHTEYVKGGSPVGGYCGLAGEPR